MVAVVAKAAMVLADLLLEAGDGRVTAFGDGGGAQDS